MAHSSVGIVIVVVFVIILLFVAFGCNGGRWFRQRPEAYVALTQKKKKDTPSAKVVEKNSPVAPEPVTLLEEGHVEGKHAGVASGASGSGSAGGSTHASYGSPSYHAPSHDEDKEKDGRSHLHALPNSKKKMEYLHGGEDAPDTAQFDTHKLTHKQLKNRHQLAGRLQRHQYNSRDGWQRTLGYNNLLRPWNEDYAKAQRRACQRREEAQKQKNCDDTCVQFNESSFMYESCIDH